MKKDVSDYISKCFCQSTKYITGLPAGVIQPLTYPTQVWEDVSMDSRHRFTTIPREHDRFGHS